jgi:hypothetical protein
MAKGVKHPSPLRIGMEADEALARFIQADPREVDEAIRGSKQKKPPGGKKRKLSGGSSQGVVSLRDKRMRKRNG